MGSAAVLHVGEGVNAYTLNAVGEKDAKLTADASGIVKTYTHYRIIIDSETSNTNGSTASVLSEGGLAIIVGVAAAVVFGLGGFMLGRKKKTAVAGGTENTDEE